MRLGDERYINSIGEEVALKARQRALDNLALRKAAVRAMTQELRRNAEAKSIMKKLDAFQRGVDAGKTKLEVLPLDTLIQIPD